MKRFAVIAASALVAVLVVVGGPVASGARPAQSGNANLRIYNTWSPTYPAQGDGVVVVCVNGADPGLLAVGTEPYEIEGAPGEWEITAYVDDSATCSDTPDVSLTISMAAGDLKNVVVGFDTIFEIPYDESCIEAGTGRLEVANGSAMEEPLDIYAISTTNQDTILVQASMTPGESATVPNIPADTYNIWAYSPGAIPDESAPVTEFGGAQVQDGFQVQMFLVGEWEGDNATGSYFVQQGPDPCAEELPPTTSTTSSTTTTTTAAVSPGTAAPAVPVSGTAAYTG